MRPCEGQSVSQMSMASDLSETIAYQIYTMLDELDLPTDAEAVENYQRPVVVSEPKPIPVTLFSPEVMREILESITNEHPLNELDVSESRGGSAVKRAIIIRNKGSEGSGSGRSTSSEGDAASSDTSEDSTSRHLFSFIHRKKKDSSRGAASSSAASTSTSTSTTPSANAGTPTPSLVVVSQPPPSSAPETTFSAGSPPMLPPALSAPAPVPPRAEIPDQAYLPYDPSYGPTTSAPPVPPLSTMPVMQPFVVRPPFPTTMPLVSPPVTARTYEETDDFMDSDELADFIPDVDTSHAMDPPPFTLNNSSVNPMPMSPVVPSNQFSTTTTAQR